MRRTGKTTRFIDNAIQDYFTNGFAFVYEGRSRNRVVHEHALKVFTNRLFHEHHLNLNKDYIAKYENDGNMWYFKITNLNYEKS